MPRPNLHPPSIRSEHIQTKPSWLKVKLPSGEEYVRLKALTKKLRLHTVCEEALCPNIGECWGGGTATIMLLGDICTRACRFCAVKSGNPLGHVDKSEPYNVAEAVKALGLKYVVLTSVDRDDLSDGGAGHFAHTVRFIKKNAPEVIVEVLIPDFQGNLEALKAVVDAQPHVLAHNIETTRSLTAKMRDRRADYDLSLKILDYAKRFDSRLYTKSSMMLGLGERDDDVLQAMKDLRSVGVDILTIGQYLRPSIWHLPVVEYVEPTRFEYFKKMGEDMGFHFVAADPLVRSSYRAGEFFIEHMVRGVLSSL